MDDSIHNGVEERRRSEPFVPVDHRVLGRHYRGVAIIADVADLECVLSLDIGKRMAQPVVDDQELGLSQDVRELRIRAFRTGYGQILAPVKGLDFILRQQNLHVFMKHLIGHAVIMPIVLDVIINPHFGPLPFGRLVRTIGKRPKGRAVERLNRLPAAFPQIVHYLKVQLLSLFRDRKIYLLKA